MRRHRFLGSHRNIMQRGKNCSDWLKKCVRNLSGAPITSERISLPWSSISVCAWEMTGKGSVSITLGLADDTLYEVKEDGKETGAVKTGLGGKLSLSLDLSDNRKAFVSVKKA